MVRGLHNTILFGYVSCVACGLFFTFIGGVLFEYPGYRQGWIALGIMVVLYIIYFGIGIDRSVLALIQTIP